MNWIANILSDVVLLGAFGFMGKLWMDKRLSYSLNKELETFKSNLSKDISRDISKYSIQQQWINDKRMELFAQLYELMIEADFELKALLLNIKTGSDVEKRATTFSEKYLEINTLIHKNELFLEEEIVKEIRNAYMPFQDIATSIIAYGDIAVVPSSLPEDMMEIIKIGDIPRKDLIKRFRELSGISINEKI